MTTALLLIDIQNDYFPGGKMELAGSLDASWHAAEILAFFRKRSLPLVHIQHIANRPGASFFLPGTEGVKIHPSTAPQAGEMIIRKNYPNSFRDTPLLSYLQEHGVAEVVVAGMMTHMCVDATVRAAFDYGFKCIVVHDACASRELTFEGKIIPAEHVHLAFLSALNFLYARVVSTAEYLQTLV